LLASKEKLTQVLANLLMNAVESFDDSTALDKSIFIKLKRNRHYLVIEVKDYGSGISDDNLPKLFSPRFSTKMENQGLGLGLYFCQETMEDYFDSRITVSSKLGEGSTFSLRIKNKFILGKNGRTKRNRKIS
jgi:signal transduction histidine kinase